MAVSDPSMAQHNSQREPASRAAHSAEASEQSHVQRQVADSHGAVDLSASGVPAAAPADGDAGVQLNVPLIRDCDDAQFEDIMATSRTVPVLMALWSSRSLESSSVLSMLEGIVRERSGAFQLVKIEVEKAPGITRALQVQALPTVCALIGGRPIPLFQGNAIKEQVVPVLDELLTAAQQMGVTGRVAVSGEDVKAPVPPEHQHALDLEESGDLDGAIAAWEKIVERNARDHDAEAQLARVRLLERGTAGNADNDLDHADELFNAGQHAQAFDVLISALEHSTDDDRREELRTRILDLFRVAGSSPEVNAARRRLATALMI